MSLLRSGGCNNFRILWSVSSSSSSSVDDYWSYSLTLVIRDNVPSGGYLKTGEIHFWTLCVGHIQFFYIVKSSLNFPAVYSVNTSWLKIILTVPSKPSKCWYTISMLLCNLLLFSDSPFSFDLNPKCYQMTAVALFRQSDPFAFAVRQWPTRQWAFILTTYAFVSVWMAVVSRLPALLSHLQHTYPVWMYIYLYIFDMTLVILMVLSA